MKTKNRSLFSRMCKCYGKKSHAQVQQIEEEPSTVAKVSDEVTLLFVQVIVGGTLRDVGLCRASVDELNMYVRGFVWIL